jgi:hypothetical protein
MFTRPVMLSIKAIGAVPNSKAATMSDATLACRMCTQPFSDVRLPKLASGNITYVAFEYHTRTSPLAARMCLCALSLKKGVLVCSCWPIRPTARVHAAAHLLGLHRGAPEERCRRLRVSRLHRTSDGRPGGRAAHGPTDSGEDEGGGRFCERQLSFSLVFSILSTAPGSVQVGVQLEHCGLATTGSYAFSTVLRATHIWLTPLIRRHDNWYALPLSPPHLTVNERL